MFKQDAEPGAIQSVHRTVLLWMHSVQTVELMHTTAWRELVEAFFVKITGLIRHEHYS